MLEEERDNILYFYSVQNKSINWIANFYNCSRTTIKTLLKNNGVDIRSNNAYKSRKVDENFFEVIDTEQKAYILGFVYADGYISKNYFGIKVSLKDVELLEKIKSELKSEHKIGIYINNNGYSKGNEYASFILSNKKIVKDLLELGVKYNKSKILKFPDFNQVPENLIRHFIRGYFDGDGSICGNGKCSVVSFVGTKDFLEGVLKNLKTFINTRSNIYKYKEKDIYEIKVGGRNQVKSIYKYLYEDASIFLGRKKNRFEDLINIV